MASLSVEFFRNLLGQRIQIHPFRRNCSSCTFDSRQYGDTESVRQWSRYFEIRSRTPIRALLERFCKFTPRARNRTWTLSLPPNCDTAQRNDYLYRRRRQRNIFPCRTPDYSGSPHSLRHSCPCEYYAIFDLPEISKALEVLRKNRHVLTMASSGTEALKNVERPPIRFDFMPDVI